MRFNTALLHSAKLGDENTGATLTPIYQSSAFYQPSAEQHEKLFHNKATGYSYTRINNPTIAAFEERMTNLEKGVGYRLNCTMRRRHEGTPDQLQ